MTKQKENKIMVIKKVKLDGKQNGILVYSYVHQSILKKKDGTDILFVNEELAKLYVEYVRGLKDPMTYELQFHINGENISFDLANRVDDVYHVVSKGEIIVVEPNETKRVEEIGYFVFHDNNVNPDNVTDGKAVASGYFTELRKAVNDIVKYPNRVPALASVGRISNILHLPLKGTTASVNVMYNSQIMNLNQNRKNKGLRAFRFDRDKNKFTSLYCFIQRDPNESYKFKGLDSAHQICLDICEELGKAGYNVTYETIDLKYPIEITDKLSTNKEREEDKND
jgi:hypothetical protein